MHRALSGFGKRRMVRFGATLAALASAGALTLSGAAAQAAPSGGPHPQPHPGRTGHHFSDAAIRVGAASTPTARADAAMQALSSSPSGLQKAYDVAPLFAQHIDGTGLTIATLVSFGDKNAQAYIDSYDSQNGLPATTIQTIEPAGAVPGCNDPGVDTATCNSWGGETDLDITMIHTLAPGAKIMIIATPVAEVQGLSGFPEMMTAMDYTVTNKLANVISMSLGTPEDDFTTSAELHNLDSHFKAATDAGTTVLASTGDDGADGLKADNSTYWGKRVASFPADETYVTAVGGTVLSLNSSGTRTKPDVLWTNSGGGVSHEFGIPTWQQNTAAATGATGRSLPDITLEGTSGTSESSPLMAALVGLADQSAGHGLGLINPALYAIGPNGTASGIVDVTGGCNSTSSVVGYCAGTGFDIVSGWGTVDAAKFVPALVAASGSSGDTVTVTNPGTQTGTVGTAASLQITATDSAPGQTLTYTASGLPAGLSISAATGLISGTPTAAGTSTVVVKATDTTNAFGSISFTWTVNSAGGGVTNGGFEAGSLTGWTTTGVTAITTSGPHSGTDAALVGSASPSNTSSITQTLTAPSATSTLTFWYNVTCPDTVTYDWATATLKDNTTGTTTTPLAKTCVNPSSGWKQVNATVTAGHSYTLTLTSKDDNYPGDATYTKFDDVAVH
ncbi:putative Ig domain-containing protein [Catenulispora rubra]|uniref:putative Ig domain-containing protein n=1 Tax=Catenulispora rubra TaxID=280293 RepID=UPI00189241B0|nr:putative Ig domain-containing protein [Catenulispora rubra]